jgi:hypothetical protein
VKKIKWIEINLPFESHEHTETGAYKDSFSGRGLNKPGTLIEIEETFHHNKTRTQHLIGDINVNRGVCDDCTAFQHDAIVTKYAVVFKHE